MCGDEGLPKGRRSPGPAGGPRLRLGLSSLRLASGSLIMAVTRYGRPGLRLRTPPRVTEAPG
eukprot:768575-Hanusia_phi.AAC.1